MFIRFSRTNSLLQGCVGDTPWMAPEVLANETYTEKVNHTNPPPFKTHFSIVKVDVYSFGILLW